MNPPAQQEWEAAALRLFEDEYAFVANGPRHHDDWRTDVLAVMARAAADPRGWLAMDGDREENTADPSRGSSFPFTVSSEARIGEILHEVGAYSAAQLLVVMTDEWFQVENIRDFPERKEILLADAHILLSRYLPDCSFHTTAGNAAVDRNADFFHDVTGGSQATGYLSDLGLVAVSDDEVGVFWRFNAY